MKLDYKIIFSVLAFLTAALVLVFSLRHFEHPTKLPANKNTSENSATTTPEAPIRHFVEQIQPNGAPTTLISSSSMQLEANKNGITLSFPNCKTSSYQDKFFLHQHPENSQPLDQSDYVNLDFDLKAEKLAKETDSTSSYCVVKKIFPTNNSGAVVVGQFAMPEGKCCQIIWSRTYIFNQAQLSGTK